MIYHQKKLSIILERSIFNLFKKYNLKPIINHSYGIDLYEIKNNLFFELKSCYNFRYRSINNRNIRIGVYVIDINQLDKIDYFIFIQIINKKNNIDYIKDIMIYVVKINYIYDYINRYNININSGQFWISIYQIKKIPKQEIKNFLKNL